MWKLKLLCQKPALPLMLPSELSELYEGARKVPNLTGLSCNMNAATLLKRLTEPGITSR